MKKFIPMILTSVSLLHSTSIWAGVDGMAHMPQLEPKKIYTVKDHAAGEALRDSRGFGEQEPVVRMMNLMMVEGSGMDMSEKPKAGATAATKSAAAETYEIKAQITPDPPKSGVNVLLISVHDVKIRKPATGLKLKVSVSMTTMDMGTEEPPVSEVSPGDYQVKVAFSMKGGWSVKVSLPGGEAKVFNFDAGAH